MSDGRFHAEPVLARLKDFQRRTVDYVFDHLFVKEGRRRFLVADEVGLGKTLVARGLIARALEHLQDRANRIDIIYVCSNAAIAGQNVNRLNVSGKGFAIATRLTFLPTQVHALAENRVNFISFTPTTAFDLKGRGGRVEERALIYQMLRGAAWDVGRGFLNLMQGPVRKRESWLGWARDWEPAIDRDLAQAYREAVDADEDLTTRLAACRDMFQRYREDVPWGQSNERYGLIGELRHLLARICVHALKPDLVILDEFQRFKDILDGEDEAALLARSLFECPGARTLLLSATPYKMLSLDHEQEDDHYPDFLRTLSFLFGDPSEVEEVRTGIRNYRQALFALSDGSSAALSAARDRLQRQLLTVMCRTERVGITRRLDAMLIEPPRRAMPTPGDLDHAAVVDRAARAVGAQEPIEYWKSSPYLLNFLKHYELRRKIDAALEAPAEDLLEVIRGANSHMLAGGAIDAYDEIDAGNARMRVLFGDTIDQGLWRLLWLPPSLPYVHPAGAYADVGPVTKTLVFSSWNVVPDAIAALCSYEAERRMLAGLDGGVRHSELYDRLKPLLKFTKGRDDRLTGMPALAWLMPSPVLAATIDPLEAALRLGEGGPIPLEAVLADTREKCERLLSRLDRAQPGTRPDERWYWAAPALLEANSPNLADWCRRSDGWVAADAEHDPGARFRDHVNLLVSAIEGDLPLGPQPDDLALVTAELALAGPGTCALRALRRVAPELEASDPRLLSAAARVAGGFRTLFNIPETIALLRGGAEETYWRLTLRYGLEGNLQAVLDEQVHMLLESEGLTDHEAAERVAGVAAALASSLSLRTSQIKVDELRANGKMIERSEFNTRCRFAVRFGDLKDDRDSTFARAGTVREAFNSPFRPFVLASTSIGQEGLDFHTWCHAVVHWNLPSNPVDLEQREGRIHRYKGHAVRKNVAERVGLQGLQAWDRVGDPWGFLFEAATALRAPGSCDLSPYWVFEEGSARVERRVPLFPFSKEVQQLDRLKRCLALYRLVFGQPRQEDLLTHLADRMDAAEAERAATLWRISLEPPR